MKMLHVLFCAVGIESLALVYSGEACLPAVEL